MHTPVRQMTIVALPDPARLLDEESPQPEQRTDQQSPGHGLIEHQQAPLEPSHARPIRLQNIVRLGIDPRDGEVDVAMMRAMALSVERVRKPQPQRWKYHGEAQPRRHAAEGVNGFMLQRKMPGDEIGADGHDDPPGQQGVEPDQEHPCAIQHQGDQPGGPINLEERFFHGCMPALGSSLTVYGELAKGSASRNAGWSVAARRCSRQYRRAASKFTRSASYESGSGRTNRSSNNPVIRGVRAAIRCASRNAACSASKPGFEATRGGMGVAAVRAMTRN